MSNINTFFDQLQERINAFYIEKSNFDLAEKQVSGRKSSELDREGLYITASLFHDAVRGLTFNEILYIPWQESIYAFLTNNPNVKDFYDLYTKVVAGYENSLVEFAARHIALNPVNPLTLFDTRGAMAGNMHEPSINKVTEIESVINQVSSILYCRPYIVFLFAISLCRIHLVTADV